jgi:hypothetical protein
VKTEITGYSFVLAENMGVVKTMLADSPHFMIPQANIEVLEMISM